MQTAKVVTQKKRNLKCKQKRQNKLPGKRNRDIKRKAIMQRMNCDCESDWEISDFLSSENSCDEWLP